MLKMAASIVCACALVCLHVCVCNIWTARSDRFQKLLYYILCKILQWPTGRTFKCSKNTKLYSNRYSDYVCKSGNMYDTFTFLYYIYIWEKSKIWQTFYTHKHTLAVSHIWSSIASSLVKSQSPAETESQSPHTHPLSHGVLVIHSNLLKPFEPPRFASFVVCLVFIS